MDGTADLLWVMDTLSSARMEVQGRLLGIGILLDELREPVSLLHSERIENPGRRWRDALRLTVARLRNVLDAVLHRQATADACYQVPALYISNLIFRRDTTRALRQLLEDLTTSDKWSGRTTSDMWSDRPRVVLTRIDSIELARRRLGMVPRYAADLRDLHGPLVGRAELVEEMLKILLTDEQDGPLVVPIVGGPGIGKTRLAKELYVDARVTEKFHVRRWVEISLPFDNSYIYIQSSIQFYKDGVT